MRYTLPRRRVALIMAAILLSGCYEGAGPVGPVKPAASLLPLRLVSSTPIQGEKRAPLFGDITFTLSEDLVASSISSETVQLSPSAAGVGHSGHSLGPGAVNALGGTLISLLGSDNTANLVDQVITPGATIMGQVRLNNDERTVVFTPNNQLMSGMTYTIALHGIKSKDGRTFNEHFVPLTFTTAKTIATRLVNYEVKLTSILKTEESGHSVSFYPGTFRLGEQIPPALSPTQIAKHDSTLATATNFIVNPVSSITYKPIDTIKRYSANVLEEGKTVALANFSSAGPNNVWGDSDDLVSSYIESSGRLQKVFISDTSHFGDASFSGRAVVGQFIMHDMSVMLYDAVNKRSLLKHITYTSKNSNAVNDATAQANAATGEVTTPSEGAVLDYHDYIYGKGVTNKGRLLVRLRLKPAPNTRAYSSTDKLTYCREFSYNMLGQLVKLTDYQYGTAMELASLSPSAAYETCPTDSTRRLLLYTINEYDQSTGAMAKLTSKRPSASLNTAETPADGTIMEAFFEPI